MRYHITPQYLPLIGERVFARFWGTRQPMLCDVIGHGRKNGRPLVDLIDSNDELRWAYLDQLTPVYPTEPRDLT